MSHPNPVFILISVSYCSLSLVSLPASFLRFFERLQRPERNTFRLKPLNKKEHFKKLHWQAVNHNLTPCVKSSLRTYCPYTIQCITLAVNAIIFFKCLFYLLVLKLRCRWVDATTVRTRGCKHLSNMTACCCAVWSINSWISRHSLSLWFSSMCQHAPHRLVWIDLGQTEPQFISASYFVARKIGIFSSFPALVSSRCFENVNTIHTI